MGEGRQDDEIRISAESVGEEDLNLPCPPLPHAAGAKAFRLLLTVGEIILRPLPFGQTSFTFIAQISIAAETDQLDADNESPSSRMTSGRWLINAIKSGENGERRGDELRRAC